MTLMKLTVIFYIVRYDRRFSYEKSGENIAYKLSTLTKFLAPARLYK